MNAAQQNPFQLLASDGEAVEKREKAGSNEEDKNCVHDSVDMHAALVDRFPLPQDDALSNEGSMQLIPTTYLRNFLKKLIIPTTSMLHRGTLVKIRCDDENTAVSIPPYRAYIYKGNYLSNMSFLEYDSLIERVLTKGYVHNQFENFVTSKHGRRWAMPYASDFVLHNHHAQKIRSTFPVPELSRRRQPKFQLEMPCLPDKLMI